MTKRSTKKKTEEKQTVSVEKPAGKPSGTTARKKPAYDPYVKQYMVSGAKPGQKQSTICVFILATCGAKAREMFYSRYPDAQIWQVMQTAESVLTKSFIETHDQFSKSFWTAADEFRRKAYAEQAWLSSDASKLAVGAPDENLD